jgi:hypothetical protein
MTSVKRPGRVTRETTRSFHPVFFVNKKDCTEHIRPYEHSRKVRLDGKSAGKTDYSETRTRLRKEFEMTDGCIAFLRFWLW